MNNAIVFKDTWPDTQVLLVTAEGEFQWHENADRMIEEGDFSASPAAQHILRALRKKWVGLSNADTEGLWGSQLALAKDIEAILRSKNT